MGTNYHVYIPNEDVTKDGEKLHIGKSSSGWVFSLRVYPELGINTLYDWLSVLSNLFNQIRDEYSAEISLSEMIQTITARRRDELPDFTQADLAANHAQFGPNNLLRTHDTTRHGEGTWDYCDYEFC